MNSDIAEIKVKVEKTLRDYGVIRAGVFGSYARGSHNGKSDVDILIELDGRRFSLFDLVGLKMKLEHLLKRKVDLLTYKSLHKLLKKQILREEIKII